MRFAALRPIRNYPQSIASLHVRACRNCAVDNNWNLAATFLYKAQILSNPNRLPLKNQQINLLLEIDDEEMDLRAILRCHLRRQT